MPYIKLLETFQGPTPFDGEYVVEYDPTRDGVDKNGDVMNCHLVTTPDIHQATCYTIEEAFELWRRSHGVREDGNPNRPLTAWTVEFEYLLE